MSKIEGYTGAELDRIDAYTEKASVGPWHEWRGILVQTDSGVWLIRPNEEDGQNEFMHEEDGEFCANARTDLPLMVAEVRRLCRVNEDLRSTDAGQAVIDARRTADEAGADLLALRMLVVDHAPALAELIGLVVAEEDRA